MRCVHSHICCEYHCSRCMSHRCNNTSYISLYIASPDVFSLHRVTLNPRPLGPEPAPKEPTDGFKIGDRVWIAGNRPGAIAFIGETQFSTGEWAGVVLSGPVGKVYHRCYSNYDINNELILISCMYLR